MAYGTDGDNRLFRLQIGRARPHEPEISTGGHGDRSGVHHVRVRYVRIRMNDLVDFVGSDQFGELAFRIDLDPFFVQRTGELGGIHAIFDVRYLRCGKRDDLVILVVPKVDVEVVEVPACGSHDDHSFLSHKRLFPSFGSLLPNGSGIMFWKRCHDVDPTDD